MPSYYTFARVIALAGCLLMPALAHAALPPAGYSYLLNVTTSFEPAFTDCWTFGSNGRFIHSNQLRDLSYQLTGLNTNADHVQAIWQGRVSIAFSALVSGTSISGDAVDYVDRTYNFTGTQVASCVNEPAARTGHGFLTR
jgi:hypothetical protein